MENIYITATLCLSLSSNGLIKSDLFKSGASGLVFNSQVCFGCHILVPPQEIVRQNTRNLPCFAVSWNNKEKFNFNRFTHHRNMSQK